MGSYGQERHVLVGRLARQQQSKETTHAALVRTPFRPCNTSNLIVLVMGALRACPPPRHPRGSAAGATRMLLQTPRLHVLALLQVQPLQLGVLLVTAHLAQLLLLPAASAELQAACRHVVVKLQVARSVVHGRDSTHCHHRESTTLYVCMNDAL